MKQQDRIKQAHREELERKKEQEREEQKMKDEERDRMMEESIMALPEEPPEGDGVCTVSFRSADGSKNMNRRFLKKHKIKSLYDYIRSLGTDAGFEEDGTEFELMQNFPR